jgi:hypothetical protein
MDDFRYMLDLHRVTNLVQVESNIGKTTSSAADEEKESDPATSH